MVASNWRTYPWLTESVACICWNRGTAAGESRPTARMEAENQRSKQLYADLSLENYAIKKVLRKK